MSYGFNSDKSKFPLGLASDLPDPTKTPLKIIGELQNQIIDSASIENGSTASKAYASGDYVCFQGALCKASKAISQGDTLSIGNSANDNLTLTDAAAEFARINSDLDDMKKNVRNIEKNLNTTSGVYTAPCDGYLYVACGTTATSTSRIRIEDSIGQNVGIVEMHGEDGQTFSTTTFIRKGMRLEVTALSGGNSAIRFYGFS